MNDLTEDDSIIKTELAKILFGKKRKLNQVVDNLIENFYICIEECRLELDEILKLVPVSWDIDIEEVKDKINKHLFSDGWSSQCERNFRSFIQSFILNSK
jgi:hypothetical protein